MVQDGIATAAQKGQETRNRILGAAVDIASVEGLEGLTIGRLATTLGMSKSGLFGHFGSKEGLQLATLAAAREIFIQEVIRPALQAPRGLARIWALCNAWMSYIERGVFKGGCFYFAASAEFDSRPGPVRDLVATDMREWLDFLEVAFQKAQEQGQLMADVNGPQLAFELNSLFLGANWAMQLYGDMQAADRARLAVLERLHSISASNASPLPPLETINLL